MVITGAEDAHGEAFSQVSEGKRGLFQIIANNAICLLFGIETSGTVIWNSSPSAWCTVLLCKPPAFRSEARATEQLLTASVLQFTAPATASL